MQFRNTEDPSGAWINHSQVLDALESAASADVGASEQMPHSMSPHGVDAQQRLAADKTATAGNSAALSRSDSGPRGAAFLQAVKKVFSERCDNAMAKYKAYCLMHTQGSDGLSSAVRTALLQQHIAMSHMCACCFVECHLLNNSQQHGYSTTKDADKVNVSGSESSLQLAQTHQ